MQDYRPPPPDRKKPKTALQRGSGSLISEYASTIAHRHLLANFCPASADTPPTMTTSKPTIKLIFRTPSEQTRPALGHVRSLPQSIPRPTCTEDNHMSLTEPDSFKELNNQSGFKAA
jgi:hypothetical protein